MEAAVNPRLERLLALAVAGDSGQAIPAALEQLSRSEVRLLLPLPPSQLPQLEGVVEHRI
jgi:hypothetical protein